MFVAVRFLGSFVGFFWLWSAYHFADRHFSPLCIAVIDFDISISSLHRKCRIDSAEEGYTCLDHSIAWKKKSVSA